jgi:hypothetical protein
MAFASREEIKKRVDKSMGNPDEEMPLCDCGVATVKRECRKEGPNQGREFYSCQTCRFFQWADAKKRPANPPRPRREEPRKRAREDDETDEEDSTRKKKRKDDDTVSDFAAAAEALSFGAKQQNDLLQSIIEATKLSLKMIGNLKEVLDFCPKVCGSPEGSDDGEKTPLDGPPVPITKQAQAPSA